MRLMLTVLLLCVCGCTQYSTDRNKRTVRDERLGVVIEKTAPKEVVVEDTYEVITEVK